MREYSSPEFERPEISSRYNYPGNLRDGIINREAFRLPGRVFGKPPLAAGPTKDVTVDIAAQLKDYYLAMGWNPDTGVPRREVFERLALDFELDLTEDSLRYRL